MCVFKVLVIVQTFITLIQIFPEKKRKTQLWNIISELWDIKAELWGKKSELWKGYDDIPF